MIIDDNPEVVVLGDLDGSLRVSLAVDAHVIVVSGVGTVRVKVNSYSIVAHRFHPDQQYLHVGSVFS